MTTRCAYCNVRITGSTRYCRTHKHALRRGARRIVPEKLIVATCGGSWWAWSPRGDVLANRNTRTDALIMLGSRQTIEDIDNA